MRYLIWVFILTIGFIAIISCEQNKANNSDSRRESVADDEAPLPPDDKSLLLEDEPLLLEDEPLLLEDSIGESTSGWSASDNSRCHVCHMNYVSEDIAVVHARAGIGCADCHGQSDAHIDDESWASGGNGTAPEIMYLPEAINPLCMGCHPEDKLNAIPHKDALAGKIPGTKYCTDCHGDHRLVRRKCKWK